MSMRLCPECGDNGPFYNSPKIYVCISCSRKRCRRWYKKNMLYNRHRIKAYYKTNRSLILRKRKEIERSLRLEALTAYSSGDIRCACCGEDQLCFMAIDHIKPVRGKKRRLGLELYYWLRRNGWPKGFQVLCHNCNLAKSDSPCCPCKAGARKMLSVLK